MYDPLMYSRPMVYQPMQPVNGLVVVDDISAVEAYQLPPNSVSQPFFLRDDDVFLVKMTDGTGAPSMARFSYSRIEDPEPASSALSGEYVTKKDFEEFANMVLEAIDGKHDSKPPAGEE